MSIWGSLGQGEPDIRATDPDYEPSDSHYVVDVAVADGYNDYTRLGIWAGPGDARYAADQPCLDVTVCMDRENVRRLIERLTKAIS